MWTLWFIPINLLTLALMWVDKRNARKGARRIPERVLFAFAAAGGSVGAIAGMYLLRHKTKHLRFVLGLPSILLLQMGVLLWLSRTI